MEYLVCDVGGYIKVLRSDRDHNFGRILAEFSCYASAQDYVRQVRSCDRAVLTGSTLTAAPVELPGLWDDSGAAAGEPNR